MAKVFIPTALRAFADGKAQVEVGGATAGEVVAALAELYPDIRRHIYDAEGKLRSYVNVFVGEEDIRNFGGLGAPVPPDGEVTLVPAIAGGVAGALRAAPRQTDGIVRSKAAGRKR
ncbi:MAG: MoaD/ThiS family protein [Acidobacteriota bacterium]|jgi:molybdopterin converting factor small subunit|nr:MoaD/ThiS family protein [Acidobacteriota bacterium]